MRVCFRVVRWKRVSVYVWRACVCVCVCARVNNERIYLSQKEMFWMWLGRAGERWFRLKWKERRESETERERETEIIHPALPWPIQKRVSPHYFGTCVSKTGQTQPVVCTTTKMPATDHNRHRDPITYKDTVVWTTLYPVTIARFPESERQCPVHSTEPVSLCLQPHARLIWSGLWYTHIYPSVHLMRC